jgi:deoxyribodipyrimidine photo-lyase
VTDIGERIQVFSSFHRRWIEALNKNLHWIAEAPMPTPNDCEIHSHSSYADLFNQEVPDEVEGFQCEDREKMKVIWPEGHSAATEVRCEERRTSYELIHNGIDAGAVLAHESEGFTVRRRKPPGE